jgi:ubiquinone/menaquinone biosynthesis C-methylase UbiE
MENRDMLPISNRDYLKNNQYKTDANLQSRIQIHRRFSRNTYGWYRWALDHFQLKPGERILDVGCGPADIWKSQTTRLPEGVSLTLCDLSAGMVQAARAGLGAGSRFVFSVGDAQAIPFQSGSFDLVVANHMLYHVPDIQQAAREIQRVLRPGGRLVAATNGRAHLRELYDLILQVVPDFTARGDSAARFGLENGAEILRVVFPEVEVEIYEDSLFVTESSALIEYISSMWGFLIWDEQVKNRLWEKIESEIQAKGVFLIQKSSGVVLTR